MRILITYLLIGVILSVVMTSTYVYFGCPDENGEPGEFDLDIFDLIIGVTLWPVVLVLAIIKSHNDNMTLGGNY